MSELRNGCRHHLCHIAGQLVYPLTLAVVRTDGGTVNRFTVLSKWPITGGQTVLIVVTNPMKAIAQHLPLGVKSGPMGPRLWHDTLLSFISKVWQHSVAFHVMVQYKTAQHATARHSGKWQNAQNPAKPAPMRKPKPSAPSDMQVKGHAPEVTSTNPTWMISGLPK